MKVLFVTSWFPSRLHPTVGNFVIRHAHAVSFSNHELVVVHEAYSNKILFPVIEKSTVEGLEVIHLFFPRLLVRFPRFRNIIYQNLFRKLKRMNFSPDVVHGNVFYPAGFIASLISRKYKTPLVFTEHWTGFLKENSSEIGSGVTDLIKSTARNVDMFLPVSDNLGSQMRRHGIGSDNFKTVNNAVDTTLFFPVKRAKRMFTFLHISTLAMKAKNPEGIIQAFFELERSNSRLIIGGDGDVERLRKYAKSIGADPDRIHFLNTLEYAEVASQMQNADCFVLFSNFENLPCVIAESHCCGKPVIATDVGGTSEMIEDDNGILIEAGNLDQLKSAMLKMIETHPNFDPHRISEKATRRYGYQAVGNEFTAVYQMLTKIK